MSAESKRAPGTEAKNEKIPICSESKITFSTIWWCLPKKVIVPYPTTSLNKKNNVPKTKNITARIIFSIINCFVSNSCLSLKKQIKKVEI